MSYQPNNTYRKNDTSFDAWGRPKTYTDKSLFHGMFSYDIPDSLWHIKENSSLLLNNDLSNKVTSDIGKLSIVSGDSNGDSAQLISKRHPKYQPNRGHLFSTALGLPYPTSAGVREFGLFNEDNGVFFRLKSDGNLYAVVRSDGTETREEKITIPFNIDLSKGNIYDIQFQWRGVGNYKFFIGNPENGEVTQVHEVVFLNTLSESLSISNPAMPVQFRAVNLGDNVKIWAGCVDVTSEGGTSENLVYNSIAGGGIGGYAVPSSDEEPVFAVKVNNTFNGKINTRDISLSRIITSCNDESIISIYVTKDPATLDGTTWTNYGSSDNIQFSEGGDISFDDTNTNTKRVLLTRVEQDFKNELKNPLGQYGLFYLTAGDYILITIKTASGKKVWTTFEFGEEL
jgi:hypothetical protein